MAADHFCLKWNNFHCSLVNAFESLQNSEDLVDVTLMCEGRNVKAHRVILSACSPYFRNLFKVSSQYKLDVIRTYKCMRRYFWMRCKCKHTYSFLSLNIYIY